MGVGPGIGCWAGDWVWGGIIEAAWLRRSGAEWGAAFEEAVVEDTSPARQSVYRTIREARAEANAKAEAKAEAAKAEAVSPWALFRARRRR